MPYSCIGRPQVNTCDVYKLKQQTKTGNNEHNIRVICFSILRYTGVCKVMHSVYFHVFSN